MTENEERHFLGLLLMRDRNKRVRLENGFYVVRARTGKKTVTNHEIWDELGKWHEDELLPLELLRSWYTDELNRANGALI